VLHGIFLHQGITTIVKKDLSTKEKRDEAVKVLKDFKAKEAAYELREIENIEKWIDELDGLIASEGKNDKRIEQLKTIPGVGAKIALAFLAYVDVNRFANASQVSNYLGLVPRVDISCTIVKYGGITKRGNSYLRALLVQGAWSMVRSKNGGALRERFEYMKGHNVSKKKTIVGIARRLAGLMYTILRDDTKYEIKKFVTPEQRKDTKVEKLVEASA
jgi:transposase